MPLEERGYYFSFLGLGILINMFTFGINTVLVHFMSHEIIGMEKELLSGKSQGEFTNRAREIAQHLKKWATYSTPSYFFIIFLVGNYIFLNSDQEDNSNLSWKFPWLIFCIGSTFELLLSYFFAILEGCHKIVTVYKIRFIKTLIFNVIICVCIVLEISLYGLGIGFLVSSIFGVVILIVKEKKILKHLFETTENKSVAQNSLIWDMQIRLGVQSLFGLFTLGMVTPITFFISGAEQAGIIGISFQICLTIYNFSNMYFLIKIPKFGQIASSKNFKAMDKLCIKTIVISLLIYIPSTISFNLLLLYFELMRFDLNINLISSTGLICLFFAFGARLITDVLSTYIRSFKVDPFLFATIFTSISCVILISIGNYISGAVGASIGIFLVYVFINSSFVIILFRNNRYILTKV